MRTCDPKSFVSVGAAAPDPPTWLFVMYMSAQEQSNKLEAIAIRGFIIFSGDRLLFPKSGSGSRGFRNATIVPYTRENCHLLNTYSGTGHRRFAVSITMRTYPCAYDRPDPVQAKTSPRRLSGLARQPRMAVLRAAPN